MSDREIFVYVDLNGVPHRVGRLWAHAQRGAETATFKYDEEWLANDARFSLEPALALGRGAFHASPDQPLFGAIGDSAPDRWGQALMRRAERRRAEKEGKAPRTLLKIDYLLLVNDETRLGALRFAGSGGGPFLQPSDNARPIPPLVGLGDLLSATERIVDEVDSEEDLRLILAPGSSLGGARPKASVRDKDGHLAIAKFPNKHDDYNVVLWEALALALARKAGLATPAWRIEMVAKRHTLLLRRFDRSLNVRVPFLSAMSMLGARDGDAHSYLEIVDALTQTGSNPQDDKRELWARIVFSVLISNTDDHLRNHGFLYAGRDGWKLSPLYDVNPVPVDIKPRILTTAINEDDGTASLELAMDVAPYFGLKLPEARQTAKRIGVAVSSWRSEAVNFGLKKVEIDRMASAFDHDDLKKATSD
jgi:serine/threonine-protein kinase HipA